jgi:hypothetical protein
MIIGQCWLNGAPDDTVPHKNAQIGANHVTGLSNSRQVFNDGTRRKETPKSDAGKLNFASKSAGIFLKSP